MRGAFARLAAPCAVAVSGLGGCAHQPAGTAADAELLRNVAASFEIDGKLGVRTPERGYSASIRWQQNLETFEIELSGPIGIGRTVLSGTPERVSITNNRDGTRSFDAPGQALRAQLGWSPPLKALRFWVAGVPQPGRPFEPKPASTEPPLPHFAQDGWVVEVQQLADYGQWTLPRKLTLHQGETRLRLIITQWQVPAIPH